MSILRESIKPSNLVYQLINMQLSFMINVCSNMYRSVVSVATVLFCCFWLASNVSADDLVHVRLKDRLDRPADGYCFDIIGTSSNMRLDLPLFAHNCKAGPTDDSVIIHNAEGLLIFPAVSQCVTAFGINGRALPGVPLLLRPCSENASFFDTSRFQQFELAANGQLHLKESALCIAVGVESDSTYSSNDRWRVLSLQLCNTVVLSHSAWEQVSL